MEVIKSSKRVIAFKRVAESIGGLNRVECIQNLEDLLKIEGDYTLVVSGDPLLYSAADFLKRNNVKIDEIIPSISCFQYMLSKIQKNWEDASFLSLHGKNPDWTKVKNPGITIVFTDSQNTPDKISKTLFQKGFRGKIYAGFNLSYEDEIILEKSIGDEIEIFSDLSLAVVETCG
ncbi:MAG: precorrin-6y C5,15-methyltransferase (decarboxylating) subunit CbiE [Thermovenabulum sp.]